MLPTTAGGIGWLDDIVYEQTVSPYQENHSRGHGLDAMIAVTILLYAVHFMLHSAL